MCTSENRYQEKFSATTSCFLLPTFRRPGYLDIIRMHVNDEPIDVENIFRKWTSDDEPLLHKIVNDALLCDNHDKLEEHMTYINKLRLAIKQNRHEESLKVYRNLELDPALVRDEYKEDQIFLWPTFTSTSRNKDLVSTFGNYTFEIDALPDDGTYRADISNYSEFPYEEEVLFYPYSGFRVKKILTNARIIELECIDTLAIELCSKDLIPKQVKLFDEDRQMFVYLKKDDPNTYWSTADQPTHIYIIADNPNGYWDSPHRYHHKNGYFLDRGVSLWEEYQEKKHIASFLQI